MNLSAPFINRPIATSLLAIGIALSGILSFYLLAVASLPQVEFPTIVVQVDLPGASPEIMATSVATPIEKQLSKIAGITDMVSNSSLGSTKIIIQFDLDRNINGAARDVQAALNAATPSLPANLPFPPTYRKVNPADSPILIMGLTAENYDTAQLYDYASTKLQQVILQMGGVGEVIIGGSTLPAIRIEANPYKLNKYNLSLSDIKMVIDNANINLATGQIINTDRTTNISLNNQLFTPEEYDSLIISYKNNSIVRLSDVADVVDSVEDIRNAGSINGKPAVILVIFKAPGANVIETVKQIKQALPLLNSMIPTSVNLDVIMDRTVTITASLRDVEKTLIFSILLVILVVFIFLRNFQALLIPSVAMILSLLGTFTIMKLANFSLNNLSLMALTIATGFVVDDAIVVLENISRYLEKKMPPKEAALKGAKEIGFTVTSISISLIAVFIPITCMGGLVGRLFREFAVTLSIAILMSLVISLTLTPMMCSQFLKSINTVKKANKWQSFYEKTLRKALCHQNLMLLIACSAITLSILLFMIVPKGFFPQQDTGVIMASIVDDQNTSFTSLHKKFNNFIDIIKQDNAVENVIGFIGSNSTNAGSLYIALKDLDVRVISADKVVDRLRNKLNHIPGANLYMQAVQDLSIGGRQSTTQFQYTVSAYNIEEVNRYASIIMEKISKIPGITDLNNDQRSHGLQSYIKINQEKAANFGVNIKAIDETLYDAFGQSITSIMYHDMNQYSVILEVDPQYSQTPETLKIIYVKSTDNKLIPLSAFANFSESAALLSVNHQGLLPSATLSFNLTPHTPLGNVVQKIDKEVAELNLPLTVHETFRGTAQAFQASVKNEPYLILASLLAVYIILGMLYESLIHPITIISTLPSAGVGALLALLVTQTDLSVVAIIGVILLIGIVKKNAIMMIDFVLLIKRQQNIRLEEAVFQAATLRFRPIMMTTISAMLGALPLAFGEGVGSELRRPLGITIIGGLFVSQIITLYTTPVIYLAMEKLSNKYKRKEDINAA